MKAKYPERREAIQAAMKARRAANLDKWRERDRKTYRKHRLKIIARAAKYAKEHPEVVAATQAKIRAAKMGASLGDAKLILQWQTSIRAIKWVRCHWCGTKVAGKKVHFDHIVALSKGGPHSIENLCAACPECNQTKNARSISDWICAGQTFLPL